MSESYLERVTECEHGMTERHKPDQTGEPPPLWCNQASRVRVEPDVGELVLWDRDRFGNITGDWHYATADEILAALGDIE